MGEQIASKTDMTVQTGVKLLGSDASGNQVTKNADIDDIDTYFLGKRVSVPASASATGTAGDYAVEAGYFYQCVATDTWERVATSTWV